MVEQCLRVDLGLRDRHVDAVVGPLRRRSFGQFEVGDEDIEYHAQYLLGRRAEFGRVDAVQESLSTGSSSV
jgi:hypothetical protein